MQKLLFIALGGVIGALLRYAVSGLTYRYLDGVLPWGTLVVNLVGAVLIGFLWGTFEGIAVSPDLRALVFIGIIGSFTTLSTYSLETFLLFREGEIALALVNMLVTNVLSIVLVFAGFAVSRYL